jgi:hypothetical protein
MAPVLRPDGTKAVTDGVGNPIYWLDDLFAGGIRVPESVISGETAPLLWLVTGPPGTGKTMFALQLCYNLAKKPQPWGAPVASKGTGRPDPLLAVIPAIPNFDYCDTTDCGVITHCHKDGTPCLDSGTCDQPHYHRVPPGLHSMYVSLELDAVRLQENAESLGWVSSYLKRMQAAGDSPIRNAGAPGIVWLYGTDEIVKDPRKSPHTNFVGNIPGMWESAWRARIDSTGIREKIAAGYYGVVGSEVYWERRPAVVVIDSLNTMVDVPHTAAQIADLRGAFKGKTWIVMVICEERQGSEMGLHLADIVTRLGDAGDRRYWMETFHIVKAQAQDHARGGPHILKRYGKPDTADAIPGVAARRVTLNQLEGGVYVFPSVHRILGATRSWIPPAPLEERQREMPVSGMHPLIGLGSNELVGLPGNAATVFLGPRGLMKSHLAYLWMLKNLANNGDLKGLLISLRDDEEGARATLRSIGEREGIADIEGVLDRLDVWGPWLGYLPPGEFMHNVFIRVSGDARYCVVNGVDHLPVRAPLCAELDIFVPALVTLLSKSGVTSVFTSAIDQQPGGWQSGLPDTASLLLRFSEYDASGDGGVDLPNGAEQRVSIVAERVPAGGIGGRRGVMYRDGSTGKLGFAV